jgi:hypothetical protein
MKAAYLGVMSSVGPPLISTNGIRAEANMNSTTPLRLHIGRSQFRGDRTIEFTLRTCRRTALQIDCVFRFAQDSISIDVWSHLMQGIASMASRG